jgi:hemerythrin
MGNEVIVSEGNTRDQISRMLGEMKSEHEQLFQTVNEIRDAITANDVTAAKRHLMQLQIHQQSHFEHEVGLMERYDYPHREVHKQTHDSLIGALHSINMLIDLENLRRLSVELAVYLENSLKHVVEVDRPFQEFLSVFTDGDG